jgi:hypothetical protein
VTRNLFLPGSRGRAELRNEGSRKPMRRISWPVSNGAGRLARYLADTDLLVMDALGKGR